MSLVTTTSTRGIRPGMTLTMLGQRFRVLDVPTSITFTFGPIPRPWYRRLWTYLTTAPNGDATRWTSGVTAP